MVTHHTSEGDHHPAPMVTSPDVARDRHHTPTMASPGDRHHAPMVASHNAALPEPHTPDIVSYLRANREARKPTPPAVEEGVEQLPALLYASEDTEITEALVRTLLDRDSPLPPGQRYAPTRLLLMLACAPPHR